MEQVAIEAGTLVKLKSGGPLMVVDGPERDQLMGHRTGRLVCVWFDHDNEAQEASFAPAALVAVE